MTAPGVHISFFDAGEAVDRNLPAVGPLHGVLLRGDRLVVEHADVAVPDQPGVPVARWLEGVVELQRATGDTASGKRRSSMRVSAPDGLYLRFGVVGEPAASLRELGPFGRVFIGARTIEASGNVLASRPSPKTGMWTLTANADPDAVGAQRPDVGFRSTSQPYHPWMTVAEEGPSETAPALSPDATPIPTAERPDDEPTPSAPSTPTPGQRMLNDSGVDLLQRRARRQQEDEARVDRHERQVNAARAEASARVAASAREAAAAGEAARQQAAALEAAARDEAAREAAASKATSKRGPKRTRQAASPRQPTPARENATTGRIARALSSTTTREAETDGGNDWLELVWRLRFALVALFIAGVGLYGFTALQPRSSTAQPQEHIFTLGQKISGARWDYVVNGIQREPVAGTTRPRGIYLAVRLTLTNKGGDSAQASPSDFALVDAAGTRYGAESLQSGAYASPDNRSPFEWPTSYPPGRPVVTRVLFDIDPSLRGMQLVINELPGTKVRIE
jgi:hypothetical protein